MGSEISLSTLGNRHLHFSSVAHFSVGGLDLFFSPFFMLSLCLAGKFLHEVCRITDGEVYLVPWHLLCDRSISTAAAVHVLVY